MNVAPTVAGTTQGLEVASCSSDGARCCGTAHFRRWQHTRHCLALRVQGGAGAGRQAARAARKQASTQARKHASTQAREHASTQARKHASTQARKHAAAAAAAKPPCAARHAPLEVAGDERVRARHRVCGHGHETRRLRALGHRVELDGAPHRHARLQPREAHLDELLGVERAVPVAAARDGLGQHHARRVHRLPHAPEVDPPRDLLDQHGCQALGAQLLVHAEEVDLRHGERGAAHGHVLRDAGDARHELVLAVLVGLGVADANDPLRVVARHVAGPAKEVHGVVEAEHVVVVLHVVLGEEVVHLDGDGGVGEIESAPEQPRQVGRLRGDVLDLARLQLAAVGVRRVRAHLRHGLRVPELVRLVRDGRRRRRRRQRRAAAGSHGRLARLRRQPVDERLQHGALRRVVAFRGCVAARARRELGAQLARLGRVPRRNLRGRRSRRRLRRRLPRALGLLAVAAAATATTARSRSGGGLGVRHLRRGHLLRQRVVRHPRLAGGGKGSIGGRKSHVKAGRITVETSGS